MIQINRKWRRGPDCARPCLGDCVRCDATGLLAKSRGCLDHHEQLVWWRLAWTEEGQRRVRTVPLQVTMTPQPLGGVRGWWRCPVCDRRCGVLLAATPTSAIACRRCMGARYAGGYPSRNRDRQLVALLRSMASGSLDEVTERELDVLSAKRRRGARRGRRVMLRAVRLLVKLGTRVSDVCEPFSANRGGPPAVGR